MADATEVVNSARAPRSIFPMLGSLPPRLIRRGVSLATLFTTVLLLFDLNRDAERCEHDCFGPYRTYEPGHAWSNYAGSWQWEVQNAIMGVADAAVSPR